MNRCPTCGETLIKVETNFNADMKKHQRLNARVIKITSEVEAKPTEEKNRLLIERGELLNELAKLEHEMQLKKRSGIVTVSMLCKHCNCVWQVDEKPGHESNFLPF